MDKAKDEGAKLPCLIVSTSDASSKMVAYLATTRYVPRMMINN